MAQSCTSCNTPVPDAAAFCPTCGTPTSTQISGQIATPGERFEESADEIEYRHRLARALGDEYELHGLIGRGGFGAVYRAHDKRLDRAVAVKVLRHDLFPTPALLQRFDREARAVAKLRHPNILPIYTVGEGETVSYMVMPLVEGETLQAWLEREGTLPMEEAVRIAAEAAAALEAAHKLGFVHRDVKPANIMFEGDERRVLLMDFGIAKAVTAADEAITGTGVIVGSPAYMSPEQSRGEKHIDGRSDIYSLGAVAYEMLSGRRPFEADSLHELVYKQVTQEVDDLADVAPGTPANVCQAVMRCLAKEPDQRWQTAADFGKQISTAQSSAVGPESHPGGDEESWLSRRGPYVLVLLFAYGFISWYDHMLETGITPEWYEVWSAETGAWMLQYASAGLLVLLGVAFLDAFVRTLVRLIRGEPVRRVIRFLLGQPDWWQAWYPRDLRVPDSVWHRLTFVHKTLRTLVWLEMILVPAGGILLVFVVPVFQSVYASMGYALPLSWRILIPLVHWMAYAVPVTAAALWWDVDRWRRKHGVPPLAYLASLFNLRGSYWQGSAARVMLKD